MNQVPMNLPFESLASYDKPSLLLTQAFDNELTLKGGLQTLVDADGLSPNERDMFTTRLKERIGRNAITDSLVDVATNPFVLLMAVTAPVGGQALSRAGKAIFDRGAKFHPFVKEQGGMHAALGALAPMQMFRGTALTPAVQAFSKNVDELDAQMMGVVGPELKALLEKHGLDSLNPERVLDVAKKAKAEAINDLLWASLNGVDKAKKDQRWKLVRMMDGKRVQKGSKVTKKEFREKGTYELRNVATKDVEPIVSSNIDALVEREGLKPLRDAYRKATEDRKMLLFGNAQASQKAGAFVVDEQKLLRMWDGLKMGLQQKGALKGTGADMAATILGPEVAAQISSGRLGKDQVLKGLREMVSSQAPEHYLSRNLIDVKGTTDMARIMEQRQSRSLVATGASVQRVSSVGRYDPDDLKRIFKRFGSTEFGEKTLSLSEKRVSTLLGRGEMARVFRINAQESLSRYFRDTGTTHALYVQTVDKMPRLAQSIKDSLVNALPEKLAALEKNMVRSPLLDTKQMSLAEVFHRQHFLLEDRFAKEALEVILRQATGVQKIEHAATHMALIKGKQAVQWMLDSPVGKAMKGAGSWGEGLYNRFDGMAKAELTFGEAKSMSATLAKYFYVTHLGLNLSSVTMNLMQPLLYASVYGGLGNVMKAYGKAFQEMGSYLGERVSKYGYKALTDEQHTQMIGKHFKFANIEGENLIRIGRDTFSNLDAISYKSGSLEGIHRGESYFFDYPMKLFEKAEWMNRSVAAHSVENLYRSKGMDVARGTPTYFRMLSDVDEMVAATQFGGNSLNTPMSFQGVGPAGRLGNNPLVRQFLSFPLRSLTGLTFESARLGDRGAFKGISQDFIRGMGISAIFYEVGKNTFGVNLSPGLFSSSLTQAVGGERFFQDGNEYIPVPPVIDIPMNLIRGMIDPGQHELLQNNIPRLIPGGVALARSINLMPDLGGNPLTGLVGSLQRTYIDASQRTAEGGIAVFKGDGTLIGYESPGKIFAKHLGLDFGKFKEAGEFDGFLIKNRDNILDYRRRAIQALLSNEVPKMQGIKEEFKRRFGMNLTISQTQLDTAIQNRTVSRTERLLDRMPPDQRGAFQEMAAQRAYQMGVPEEAIVGADTARQRMQTRSFNALPFTPEQQQVMSQEVQAKSFDPPQAF